MRAELPVRGPRARRLGLPLPPARMPPFRRGRPLKRWRWVGMFAPELQLCVGDARVAGIPQRWWAVALPDGTLRERATAGKGGIRLEPGRVRVDAPGVRIDVRLAEGPGVEIVSPSSSAYIWTRKQGGVPASGVVALDGAERRIDAEAIVDDSAGYHDRHTRWHWSAGVGRSDDGRRIAWNLVDGIHDGVEAAERTVWVDGEPREVGPVEFASDLSGVGGLQFRPWAERRHDANMMLFRSRYRQPFGTFSGELPDGTRLAEGRGVMEEHDVLW